MQVTFLIHTKADHEQNIYLLMEILLFHGDLLSKEFLLLPQIMQRLLQFMKQVVNVFGWDRVIQHIRENSGLSTIINSPMILYKDNAACITQIREGYIKGDRNKHIAPNFFYTHELQKNGDIDVKQIRSCDNLADMFTKPLPTANFKKMVHNIGMCRLKDIRYTHEGK